MRHQLLVSIILTSFWVFVGCSAPTSTAPSETEPSVLIEQSVEEATSIPTTATPTPIALSAEEILQTSMEGVRDNSYHYDIFMTLTDFGEDNRVRDISLVGDFTPSYSWQGVTQFLDDDELLFGYEFIQVDSMEYGREANSSDEWQEISPGMHPALFLYVLPENLQNLTLVGIETWQGIPVYRLTATMSPPFVLMGFHVMYDAYVTGELETTFLIGQDSYHLHQITAIGSAMINEDEVFAEVTTTLTNHDQEVTISLPERELVGHEIGVDAIFTSGNKVAFVNNDNNIVASSYSGLRIWSSKDLTQPPQEWLQGEYFIDKLTVHPNGHTLIIQKHILDYELEKLHYELFLWDTEQPSTIDLLPLDSVDIAYLAPLLFSPDGETLLTYDEEGVVHSWSMSDKSHQQTTITTDSVLVWSGDGQQFATAVTDTIYLWNWPIDGTDPQKITLTDQLTRTEYMRETLNMTFSIQQVAFSPDGQWLVASANDHYMHVWQMNQLTASPILIPKQVTRFLTFSPDSRYLATIGDENYEDNYQIWVWETGNWLSFARLRGHEDTIWTVDFSADSQTLLSIASDDTIRLWSLLDLQMEDLE